MTSTTYLDRQVAERQRAWEHAKEILDLAAADGRDLSGEERGAYDAAMADLDRRGETIKGLIADQKRQAEIAEAAAGHAELAEAPEAAARGDADWLRKFAKGELRSVEFTRDGVRAVNADRSEVRDVTSSSTGAPVPTGFYATMIEKLRATGPMLDPGIVTVLNTAGGENLQIPRQNAAPTGTINSEGAAFGESDPTFSAFITLTAYKYGFLTQLSSELVGDSGIDIVDYLGRLTANALGYAAGSALTVGSGSSQPNGIVTASAVGGTGGTGVTGAFTYANLVDLYYTLDLAARATPGFGWMMSTSAVADARVLQDGAGQYVFAPSLDAATPDRIMGKPLHENPHMAAPGTAVKSVLAGDLSSYFVRQVGGVRLARSDEFAFSEDLVTFRAQLRVDGDLPQTGHVKHFLGGAS